MLLCCFREQPQQPKKSSKKSPNGHSTDLEYQKSSKSRGGHSQSRPLNLSLSSKEDDNSEILVVHHSNHVAASISKQQPPNRGQSICSLTSDRSSRPPSRDGSDRRSEARAPLAKEAKRLLKQKSQDSFKDNFKSVTSIPYIDATPPSSGGLMAGFTNSVTPSHRPQQAASAGKVLKCILKVIGYCIAQKLAVASAALPTFLLSTQKKCPHSILASFMAYLLQRGNL